jgi:hypothetical protein
MVMMVMTCGDGEHGPGNANNKGYDGDNDHSGHDSNVCPGILLVLPL